MLWQPDDDRSRLPALYFASANGNPAVTRALLEHGARPEVTSGDQEETSLHCAARVGRRAEIIALLISHGAQVSRRRKDGATPYALALRHANLETAAALAAHGADENAVSEGDRLLAACAAADEAAARALLAATPGLIISLGPLAGASAGLLAEQPASGALKLALDLGFPLEGAAGACETPLHRAAWFGRPGNVELLLARGARVNVRDETYGCSALAWACHGSTNCRAADTDYERCVELLIDAGANRETAINRWGAPPESMSSPAVARRLVARGLALGGGTAP